MVIIYFCALLTMVAHELGHAGVAWLNHIKVNRITIGNGWPYFTFSAGSLGQISFHPYVFRGLTELDQRSADLATLNQLAATVASGLLVNFVLLIISGWLAYKRGWQGYAFLAAINSFMFFQNITPFPGSDGGNLVQLLIIKGWIILEVDWPLIFYFSVWNWLVATLSLGIMLGLLFRGLIPRLISQKTCR